MTDRTLILTFLAASFLGLPAIAGPLADGDGKTLYTFDKDQGGVSACYDDCAAKWPPYLGKASDPMAEGWTLVDRSDGTKQWAYDGKPVYYFAGDTKAGETNGDGLGEVWHIINE